jgi:hypothetical protein
MEIFSDVFFMKIPFLCNPVCGKLLQVCLIFSTEKLKNKNNKKACIKYTPLEIVNYYLK